MNASHYCFTAISQPRHIYARWLCVLYQMWRASISKAWDWDGIRVLGPFGGGGGHVKWLDCHPRHFPWKKKHGVGIKLIHEEVRVFGWTWQFLIAAASQHLSRSHVGHCEIMQKIGLHLVFGPALHAILYLRKRHPLPAISNSAHSQRHPSK